MIQYSVDFYHKLALQRGWGRRQVVGIGNFVVCMMIKHPWMVVVLPVLMLMLVLVLLASFIWHRAIDKAVALNRFRPAGSGR